MHSLSSLFRRKGSAKPNHNPNPTQDQNPPQDPNLPNTNYPTDTTTTTTTLYAPGTGPLAHAQLHNANNLGMAGGALLASSTGGNPVMGMIEGQVVAGMITQRVQQAERHQFFKERAMEYREGLRRGEGGVGGVEGVVMGGEGGAGTSRSQKREEKRRKRWERRAKRRDGAGSGAVGAAGGVGRASSVSSLSEGSGKD